MQAYRKSDLYNKYVQEQAEEALQTRCISKDSNNRIVQAHLSKLYTPNYFIRIALGLLTIVAVVFSCLLLWLLTSASSTVALTTNLILFTILSYITLEILVKRKQYYNAGVDNVLMFMMIVFTISAFLISGADSWLILSCVVMIFSLWLSIRFTDAFMAMLSCCFLYVFLFLIYIKAGNIAKTTAPLMMMAISAVIYCIMKKLIASKAYTYHHCYKAITLLTLVTFYAAANYFIVKQLSNEVFNLQLSGNDPLPFGWLFWIFTIIIPPTYIIYGIIKRDLLMMRTGLGLVAATIFTVKYYYRILSAEIEMLFAGVILIAVSYALIKYLFKSKYGYTSKDIHHSEKRLINVEALIVAETFNTKQAPESSSLYEGGGGGGGGATGEY